MTAEHQELIEKAKAGTLSDIERARLAELAEPQVRAAFEESAAAEEV
jgi:hypothetical protein